MSLWIKWHQGTGGCTSDGCRAQQIHGVQVEILEEVIPHSEIRCATSTQIAWTQSHWECLGNHGNWLPPRSCLQMSYHCCPSSCICRVIVLCWQMPVNGALVASMPHILASIWNIRSIRHFKSFKFSSSICLDCQATTYSGLSCLHHI